MGICKGIFTWIKFRIVGFCGGKEPENLEENKVNPHMTLGPGIEPKPYWLEVSVLTRAPSLLSGLFNLDMTVVAQAFLLLISFSKERLLITVVPRNVEVSTAPTCIADRGWTWQDPST